MNVQNQVESNDVFVISDSGELDCVCFKSREKAEAYVNDNYDEDDQYLVKIFKMNEDKFCALLFIQYFSSDSKQAQEILDAIEKRNNKEFIYQQLANCGDNGWVSELYFKHFKMFLLDGGHSSDYESFEPFELKSYKDFLNRLREDIDYHEDRDAAAAKYNKQMREAIF